MLDDLMRHCSEDERVLDLFTKVSHYCDVTCIYLTQNLFPPGKFSRSISLNAHYIIAFRFTNVGSTSLCRTSALCVGQFSRCHEAAIWLPDAGLAPAYPKHTTTARVLEIVWPKALSVFGQFFT